MTPNLEAAIAAIQPLSPTERQQLLCILSQDDLSSDTQADLTTLSTQFWQGIKLKQLSGDQTPKAVSNVKDLAAEFWPEEDAIEDFLTFLRQQRKELA
ncbi:hypothetical protein IQ241_24900 [Romeria aff. gracilis LEGE 07310]|uniref:Uncharacterized protein n=1 Tax=Vasconcelosia minhoensis LEGE 07310 TaxID=915328 RepID=A0A8J7DPX9_9CYAN|nr:hypothetical protein [Romeria gracilis]MBE9080480.1 hypothetical protein [Romeria aff. gracilis LEGE 07310]